MSANGVASPTSSLGSMAGQKSPGLNQSLADMRLSIDSERPALSPTANGAGREDMDPLQRVQAELEQTREEKEAMSQRYQQLLQKLTTMRTTLGNKLKTDAEELDRREQSIQQLNAQIDDLTNTTQTLQDELVQSNHDAERASADLDAMRSRAFQDNAQETMLRERELRETQAELERCRTERDEWEHTAMQERAQSDDARSDVETYRRELDLQREASERHAAVLEFEREKATNLQSVLEDFQSAKDHELRQAVKEFEAQLHSTQILLADFKHRAIMAEMKLEDSTTKTSHGQALEQELKVKDQLISKLRHEAVIINEHLMEALRRLRRNSTDTNVDRRLVTNVLLSFLTTPRADPKRFEMLKLLATVLSWSDSEREKAGLQRTAPVAAPSFWSRASTSTAPVAAELEKTDETESFSNLWVEFLLSEAGETAPPTSPGKNNSLPSSPLAQSFSSLSEGPPGRRLVSPRKSSFGGMASSPDRLSLASPPAGKGKQKEGGGYLSPS